MTLPPRVPTASWADAADRAALLTARAAGNAYRRLPAGWEERQQVAGFARRQGAAAARAAAHGMPVPPTGFTFVRPFVRGAGAADATPAPIPLVRAQGLFALLLGLAELAEAAQEEAP